MHVYYDGLVGGLLPLVRKAQRSAGMGRAISSLHLEFSTISSNVKLETSQKGHEELVCSHTMAWKALQPFSVFHTGDNGVGNAGEDLYRQWYKASHRKGGFRALPILLLVLERDGLEKNFPSDVKRFTPNTRGKEDETSAFPVGTSGSIITMMLESQEGACFSARRL